MAWCLETVVAEVHNDFYCDMQLLNASMRVEITKLAAVTTLHLY
jgi:hypothetical protein